MSRPMPPPPLRRVLASLTPTVPSARPRAADAWHQLPADNRSRQRLRVAAEKAKHVLSANEAATIYVELAVAGFDLDVIVTRVDVATAAASVVAAAEACDRSRRPTTLPDVLPSHYTLMGAGTRILTLKDAIAAAAAPAVFCGREHRRGRGVRRGTARCHAVRRREVDPQAGGL
eukprot:gnl/Ergobibamus_cyprinoides/2286.p1 GENE.gnl/Ergobibamus_cyprinoides/2286~~gnl/Ergobibamus_cyprinoides/2286.p1  ORF type:complete len:186 (-),score=25.62 gnl/Ergobibamus_cyprinoides/2286:278-799(-)